MIGIPESHVGPGPVQKVRIAAPASTLEDGVLSGRAIPQTGICQGSPRIDPISGSGHNRFGEFQSLQHRRPVSTLHGLLDPLKHQWERVRKPIKFSFYSIFGFILSTKVAKSGRQPSHMLRVGQRSKTFQTFDHIKDAKPIPSGYGFSQSVSVFWQLFDLLHMSTQHVDSTINRIHVQFCNYTLLCLVKYPTMLHRLCRAFIVMIGGQI